MSRTAFVWSIKKVTESVAATGIFPIPQWWQGANVQLLTDSYVFARLLLTIMPKIKHPILR